MIHTRDRHLRESGSGIAGVFDYLKMYPIMEDLLQNFVFKISSSDKNQKPRHYVLWLLVRIKSTNKLRI